MIDKSKLAKTIRITKVVATRSVKGRSGDTFVGFAATYESHDDDPAGQGKDLDLFEEVNETQSTCGWTMEEARVVSHILNHQVQVAAYEAAFGNGEISAEACDHVKRQSMPLYKGLVNSYLRRSGSGDPKPGVEPAPEGGRTGTAPNSEGS